MSENWLNEKLCSLGDDKARVELGPQIIELDCTKANLENTVTAAHYQKGRKDAYGKIIEPSPPGDGNTMNCVDWRNKHVPSLWKVYKMQETGEIDAKTGELALDADGNPVQRFIKINEFEDKDEALAFAGGLV